MLLSQRLVTITAMECTNVNLRTFGNICLQIVCRSTSLKPLIRQEGHWNQNDSICQHKNNIFWRSFNE